MADALPTANYYKNLGGVNLKASQYEMSTAQFLDLRNVDFDVPNALQKRPGSTLAIAGSLSGPVTALWDYNQLLASPLGAVPTNFMMAGDNDGLWYNTPLAATFSTSFTLISTGWSNGQPIDMLTFNNDLWAANGRRWVFWDGLTQYPAGLPAAPACPMDLNGGFTSSYLFNPFGPSNAGGASYFFVNGASVIATNAGGTTVARAIYMAYAYVRNDGYIGPINFQAQARNIVNKNPGLGTEITTSGTAWGVGGFTIPSGYGISGVALYFAEDTIYNTGDTLTPIAGVSTPRRTGELGWLETIGAGNYGSYSLKPSADTTRFWFYTTIAGASLFLTNNGTATYWAATNITFGSTFSTYDGVPPLSNSFSGMPFNFFASYIPKYLEQNQNVMFYSGFSSAPSDVWFSDLGQPEIIQPDSFFEVRTNDGDRVTGLKAYNSSLVITKEKSFAKLIGNSADNFQLVDLSSDFGCLSNRTFVTRDQQLYWLDRKGIVEFTGANWTIVSGAIEPIFRRMNLSAATEKACGVHHVSRNQMWWGIPVDGSTVNNLTVVYDYLVNAWTFFDGFNAASFVYAKLQLDNPTVWRGDYSGLIHYTGSSFFSDSGRGITCLAFTRFDQEGGENQTTLWRRLFLDTAASSGVTGAITGQVFSNFDTSTVQATFQTAQTAFQSRVELGIPAKAVAAKFSHFSASLPLLINGYGWAKRGLRNV